MRHLWIAILLSVCACAFGTGPYDGIRDVSVPSSVTVEQIAESYTSWGPGTGRDVILNLGSDEAFTCYWNGCLMREGVSSGTWCVSGNRVTLQPTLAEGKLKKKPLKNLDVLVWDGFFILVDADDNSDFLKYGPEKAWCCFRTSTAHEALMRKQCAARRPK